MADQQWLEGSISIEAAILSRSREVKTIYKEEGKWSRAIGGVIKLATASGIPVQEADTSFMESQAEGGSHGGIVALVGERQFLKLGEMLASRKQPAIVMLDGIEDPFNFGQSVRALYAAGVNGVVVRPRNWLSSAAVVARASAGASERMPMAVAEDVVTAAAFYRDQGLTVACIAQKRAISLYEADLTRPLFLLIGGERRGITRSFASQAQVRLKIPYGRPYRYALGAATSSAIVGFELMRQRQSSGIRREVTS